MSGNDSDDQTKNGDSTTPPRLCSFESRRSEEMRLLIERQGGVATVAPSMQEVPLKDNTLALDCGEKLLAGKVDVMVFMTGVGARALLEVLETHYSRDEIFQAWKNCRVVVRGPKPLAVLREWKVRVDDRVPEPNTWRETLETLTANMDLNGKTIAVQEYGEPSGEFYEALEKNGAHVVTLPVYRWAMPDDVGPLVEAIEGTIAGQFDMLLFTSANQVNNILEAAENIGKKDAWLAAARNCGIASIGPTASEKIRSVGLPVHVEASPPKMGQLVKAAIAEARKRQ